MVTPKPTVASMTTTVHLLWKMAIPAPKVSHKVNKILFSWCIGIPRREK